MFHGSARLPVGGGAAARHSACGARWQAVMQDRSACSARNHEAAAGPQQLLVTAMQRCAFPRTSQTLQSFNHAELSSRYTTKKHVSISILT